MISTIKKKQPGEKMNTTAIISKWVSTSRRCALASLAILSALFYAPDTRAFTAADADAMFAAYNRAFYFTNAHGGSFHLTTDGGHTHFWERAEQLEMVLDVYRSEEHTSELQSLRHLVCR